MGISEGILLANHLELSLAESGSFFPTHPVIDLPDGKDIEYIQTMHARACPGNIRRSRRAQPIQSDLLLFHSQLLDHLVVINFQNLS